MSVNFMRRGSKGSKHVVERAQGVFLLVFLVTRSLRDGLGNGDPIRGLQQRLKALPTDVEQSFLHMLGLVDRFYHRSMARTLVMTTTVNFTDWSTSTCTAFVSRKTIKTTPWIGHPNRCPWHWIGRTAISRPAVGGAMRGVTDF